MNLFILLLSLFSYYMSAPAAQAEIPPAAPYTSVQPPVTFAYGHYAPADPYISSFDSLSGIRLYITEEELVQAKGAPLLTADDPMAGCLEYQYADVSAGVCGGVVLYIHASPAQAAEYGLMLNGQPLNPLTMNVQEVLGAPDFQAEDGDVYLRGSAALKIYRNPDTGAWDGLDLFDANSF
ncbi:hypothetical protein MHI24_11835 [Paenibacillus sp. FSL K6-1096]|uniref:hypothetical protein n=1 Tax=Paenibacillus sp. FSL K6-1096 TaxID=2921460 RepID=UPI0030ED304B